MVTQTQGRPATSGGETSGSGQQTEKNGVSRRVVVGGVAGVAVVGLTAGVLAWLNGRGGGGGLAPGEGGGGVLTGPNRVGDAIERSPRAQDALKKFFGSDALVVTDLSPAQAEEAPPGSAFANINMPDSEGLGVNVTVNHPDEGMSYHDVQLNIDEGSYQPGNWVSGTLGSGAHVYYGRPDPNFPIFTLVGGDTTPNPAHKFMLAGQFPPRVMELTPEQRLTELQTITEALDAAGALR